MAINFNGQGNPKRIYWNSTSNPVYTIKQGTTTVWKKPYVITALPGSTTVKKMGTLGQENRYGSLSGAVVSAWAGNISSEGSWYGGVDMGISFKSYNTYILDYNNITWVTEPGGSQSLTYNGTKILTIASDVTHGSLQVSKTQLTIGFRYLTHCLLYKGNMQVDLVFGMDMAQRAAFHGLYYLKETTNPNTTVAWTQISGLETEPWYAWSVSQQPSSVTAIIFSGSVYAVDIHSDYEVDVEHTEEPSAPSWRYVYVGDTIYAGDWMFDFVNGNDITVPEVDSDTFEWVNPESDFPTLSFSQSNDSYIIANTANNFESLQDVKITFIKYSGKNVKETSTKTFSGYSSSWSIATPSGWSSCNIAVTRRCGYYTTATYYRNYSKNPSSLTPMRLDGSYTAAGKTQGGSPTGRPSATIYLSPSSAFGVPVYWEASITKYYSGGSTSTATNSSTLAAGSKYQQVYSSTDSGLTGLYASVTCYCVGMTHTISLMVGSTGESSS